MQQRVGGELTFTGVSYKLTTVRVHSARLCEQTPGYTLRSRTFDPHVRASICEERNPVEGGKVRQQAERTSLRT